MVAFCSKGPFPGAENALQGDRNSPSSEAEVRKWADRQVRRICGVDDDYLGILCV